ncbi:MAG: bifunctional diaminohydroxyphosphoribosylaminopyrimidine deaminase/5-amino-6-(5-phosphoribosylamino)uracil reductase RibD [Planctomycetes bacterium]|nr:bifunctional diaminohydroxyphosphoribosylaminopyrimidine deaminase/5-amino-6-(5-phosphoribosylamino)uracil reductase RibD [Planctomycetota bacterium]
MPDDEPWIEDDRRAMERALALAARGDWRTRPNPKVGAVVARGGEVLGEGWHAQAGGPHAEAAALREVAARGGDPRGATVYVTLEPCGPFPGKRTPPCVDALLAAGVARVVVAQEDPHPEVAGRSLERLRAAGVTVEVGLLEREARRLNGPWNAWPRLGRPYVTAKWAMSLDGKIAARTGDSRWISGAESRRRAHALRGEVDAVVAGIGTVLQDDPLLTRRDAPGGDPLRVVVDSRGRLPLEGRLARTAREQPVLLATTAAAPAERLRALAALGVEAATLPADAAGRVDPAALVEALGARGVRHVLVEGGGALTAALFERDVVDRVVCFVAPKVLGGDAAPGPVRGLGVDLVARARALDALEASPSGEDVMITAYVDR